MSGEEQRTIFDSQCADMLAAGLSADPDSMICPLCWTQTPYTLSHLEHIVPSAVGGKHVVLTCKTCNNEQGSRLDAHLHRYMKVWDAAAGLESYDATILHGEHKLRSTFTLNPSSKDFVIIPQATNPAATEAFASAFKDGRIEQFKTTLNFRYRKNNFQTAVLRAGYLAMFDWLGYRYALIPSVQQIRARIGNLRLPSPDVRSLITILPQFEPPKDAQHYIAPAEIDGMKLCTVIVRARTKTTKYLAAFMPHPESGDQFFSALSGYSNDPERKSLKFTMNWRDILMRA